MAEKEYVRRTGECRVKLAPEMMGRLEGLASLYGFPVATMAAVAVAEWVATKETNQKNQRMMMLEIGRQVSGELGKVFDAIASDPGTIIEAEAIAKRAQAQLDLTLDGSGAVGG